MEKRNVKTNKFWWMAIVAVLLFAAAAIAPVAATEWPSNNNTYVPVANQPPRFTYQSSTEYYVNLMNTSPNAGANALHISSFNYSFAGDINNSVSKSGTFYVSDTGGRGCQDDVILLIGVNTTAPDDFSIDLTAKGYNWTPTDDGYLPLWEQFNGSHDQTTTVSAPFNSEDFLTYGGIPVFQQWKFAPTKPYPTYNGQTMNNGTLFNLIFIDLKAGVIGNQSKVTGSMAPTYYGNLTDFGMINVSYTLNDMNQGDIVAFNVYAYNNQTAQGQGINWYNKVLSSGTSGASGWKVVVPA